MNDYVEGLKRHEKRIQELVDLLHLEVDSSPHWLAIFPEAPTGDCTYSIEKDLRRMVEDWVGWNILPYEEGENDNE